MKCTAAQSKIMKASASKWDEKYMDQETIVYKVYTDGGSYVGITGSNPKARELRFVEHVTRFSRDGLAITGIQTLHVFSNRFLALEMEFLLRPKRNVGLNKDPGGIQGYHWTKKK